MIGIQRDIQRQKALFLADWFITGVMNQSARIYRSLNARVAREVYDRAKVLVYLRAIAHVSHSKTLGTVTDMYEY